MKRVVIPVAALLLTLISLSGGRIDAASSPVGAPILTSAVTSQRVVALTFDDGPSPFTPSVLAVLQRFGAHATFFLVGRQIALYPAFVRAEIAAGDEIGNHTYTHPDLLWLPSSLVLSQLAQTQAAARAAGGVTPHWFRPPYGAVDLRVAQLASSLGLRTILWSVDPRDWARPGVGFIVTRVLAGVRPGSVIIMHDGGGDRSETVLALSSILAALKARGYQSVTLDTLFNVPAAPAAPTCDAAGALRWFGSAGIAAQPSHRIYRTWQELYCKGTNLGPATGPEYRLKPHLMAQDFAHTAHRLVWDARSGGVEVQVVRSMAARVFAERGNRPRWRKPIIRSWLDQYLRGYDWGPALDGPHRVGDAHVEHFLIGYAVNSGGAVAWHPNRSAPFRRAPT
ncbi:MAG: polysaccharide deacetylase family protein [Chloroflexi bacterium]|nr:polysaccharide deacetylase family protein [Chloroflexota bacterium]